MKPSQQKNLNVLITICARAGSKRVKGKNIRLLNGYPLIYHTIKQARNWSKAKHVVVSTDSKKVANIAKQYGADVPFIRPKNLATDTAGKVKTIRHCLISSEIIFKEKFDCVMDLDVTSPIRTTKDLDNAYKLFLEKRPKTLFSVVLAHRNPYFNMVEEIDGKVKLSKPGNNFRRTQDAPKVYDMNASIYIYDRGYLMDENNNSEQTDNSIVYIMDEISRFDIDKEIDFKYLEFLVKEGLVTL